MLIARLKGWSHPNLKELPEEKREAFIKYWPGLSSLMKSRMKRMGQDHADLYDVAAYEYTDKQRITMEEASFLEDAGFELEYEGIDGTSLTKLTDQGSKYGEVTALGLTSGQVVQITVPDLGLLQIDEVDWLDDACTQELQTRLDEGWRILAVCPPNAQRRPDYILGRRKRS